LSKSIIIDETLDTADEPGIEGYESRWVHTRLIELGPLGQREKGHIAAEGAATRTDKHLYAVIDPGGCDALNGGRFFSLYTGKELFPASGGNLDDVRAELARISHQQEPLDGGQ
jgi:hypothetical protein